MGMTSLLTINSLSTLARVGSRCAFALSPVAAYLPQYMTLLEEERRYGRGLVAPRRVRPDEVETRKTTSLSGASISLPVRVPFPGQASQKTDSVEVPTVPCEGDCGGGRGGMSPLSVLILLASHLLRLLYFYGQAYFSAASGDSTTEEARDEIPYDIIFQSIVMISVQLMLVRSMAHNRRMRFKRDMDDRNHNSLSDLPRRPSSGLLSTEYVVGTTSVCSVEGREGRHPFLTQFLLVGRRVMRLLHPARIWNYPTLREHLEFLVLLFVSTFLHANLVLFRPPNADRGIRLVRNASVFLESCLALPQLVQNYLRKDTAGLSVIMVGGWIVGDFLKLLYFSLKMWGVRAPPITHPVGDAAGDVMRVAAVAVAHNVGISSAEGTMRTFAAGCIAALSLDIAVVVQILILYPSQDINAVRESLRDALLRSKHKKTVGQNGCNRCAGRMDIIREIGWILLGTTTARGSASGATGITQHPPTRALQMDH